MSTISFTELTNDQKLRAADLIQKLEAVDAALAEVQSQRAQAEINWIDRENFLRTERMKVQNQIRAIRQAEVTESP